MVNVREWKLHFTWSYLVPPLILAVLLWDIMSNSNSPNFRPRLSELLQIFELFWPLALALGVATLLPFERQEGMLELRLSYPRPYLLSLLQKLTLPILLWALVGAAGLALAYRGYMIFDWWLLAKVSIPPAIALAGCSLLASTLTLNTPASLLITVAWWGFELATGSRLTGNLALFPYSMRVEEIALDTNRILLVLLGLTLGAAATVLLHKRQLPAAEE